MSKDYRYDIRPHTSHQVYSFAFIITWRLVLVPTSRNESMRKARSDRSRNCPIRPWIRFPLPRRNTGRYRRRPTHCFGCCSWYGCNWSKRSTSSDSYSDEYCTDWKLHSSRWNVLGEHPKTWHAFRDCQRNCRTNIHPPYCTHQTKSECHSCHPFTKWRWRMWLCLLPTRPKNHCHWLLLLSLLLPPWQPVLACCKSRL